MNVLHLCVSVPIAGFRVAQAREYWETYPCPPPSTVYGMLLSLAGEPDRLVHKGAEIALALVSDPERSVVLRTLWRVKTKKEGPGQGSNKRPDFQELLSNIRLSVWLRKGSRETRLPSLFDKVSGAIDNPKAVSRFGALSLGESTHLINEVRPCRNGDPKKGRMLLQDDRGDLSLPIWPDHVGSAGTRWGQFRLVEAALNGTLPEAAWTAIRPPDNR